MRITFLGTGTSQGVPVIACKCATCLSDDPKDKRLRSSVLVEDGGNILLIDTGPDFREQMLRAHI
ncbi:MAG: MBL fold metallo-hydrolase, partial [Bacteroidales bacterium]|nr:MBL fold metallo-hydrolase [Bacteroidales bacterium]